MDFTLNEEQQLLKKTVREFAETEIRLPPDASDDAVERTNRLARRPGSDMRPCSQ